MSSIWLKAYQRSLALSRDLASGVADAAGRLGILDSKIHSRMARWPREFNLQKSLASPGEGSDGVGRPRVWFHLASHGELESLWTVILEVAKDPRVDLMITVFSESGDGALNRLLNEIKSLGGQWLYAGASPLEGDWCRAWERLMPTLWVSAKYEAWPEVWALAAEKRVPILIVGARARLSLSLAGWMSRVLVGAVPRLILAAAHEEDRAPLTHDFPDEEILVTGDPRWDRVFGRVQPAADAGVGTQPRGKKILEVFSHLPRPFTLLSQVWPSDLEVWKSCFESVTGTLWLVPHRVDPEMTEHLASYLERAGIAVIQTSAISNLDKVDSDLHRWRGGQGERICVFVDEIGVLLDLYSGMDRAYVGGGFHSAGIHSTLEPAVAGLPVACGLRGTSRFSEVTLLQADGQLTLVKDSDSLKEWLCSGWGEPDEDDPTGKLQQMRKVWQQRREACRGATQRVVDLIRRLS